MTYSKSLESQTQVWFFSRMQHVAQKLLFGWPSSVFPLQSDHEVSMAIESSLIIQTTIESKEVDMNFLIVIFIFCKVLVVTAFHKNNVNDQSQDGGTILLGFDNVNVPGLVFDLNICQVFPPPLGSDGHHIATGFNVFVPNRNKTRFIMVYECDEFQYTNEKPFYCENSGYTKIVSKCHEKLVYLWSSTQSKEGERFPRDHGLILRRHLMLTVVYENTESTFNDNLAVMIHYRKFDEKKTEIHRLVVGHQAITRHVVLSGVEDWKSLGICSGSCPKPEMKILSVESFTRKLGTKVKVMVGYKPEQSHYYNLDEALLNNTKGKSHLFLLGCGLPKRALPSAYMHPL